MKRVRPKLTYSNVVATLCLVLLVGGGTAFAANQLEKESVGTRQLAKGAVTPSKLSKSSKRTLTGPRGAQGPQGFQGPQGPKGDTGAPGPFTDTLPSGKTMKGQWSFISFGESGQTSFSYGFPLATPPKPSNVHFILDGAPTPAGCSGNAERPGAAPGNLCVFVSYQENVKLAGTVCVVDPTVEYSCEDGIGEAFSTTGAAVYAEAETVGNRLDMAGSWAVTAP